MIRIKRYYRPAAEDFGRRACPIDVSISMFTGSLNSSALEIFLKMLLLRIIGETLRSARWMIRIKRYSASEDSVVARVPIDLSVSMFTENLDSSALEIFLKILLLRVKAPCFRSVRKVDAADDRN